MYTYIEITIRAITAYIALLIITRIMGKREITQMTFFDYIVGITIGAITSEMITSTSLTWFEVLPALIVFGIFQIISAILSMKSKKFRRLVDGSPGILIKDGKIMEDNLSKEKVSVSELMTKLREKNAFNLADVEFAVLETDGKISVQFKPDKQPLTPYDVNFNTQDKGMPRVVIEDGNILGDKLKDLGITRSWLLSKLGDKDIYTPSQVMLAQVDKLGNLYVDLYDDK